MVYACIFTRIPVFLEHLAELIATNARFKFISVIFIAYSSQMGGFNLFNFLLVD